ncbi:lytic transglycosylase domain-containing protein [Actinophytocola oryzae]|uniref:Transglycosylase protein with SLT domain n=1 Tax=Actinophytocola oryzae TaxID=502181 RepID=A0A4R7VVK6_9PSEU|nr:lytic murein transglycosylase [Actinophytocola oryzae]TDV53655.1 transglycosylase protein with SLT domain [Actinophytocola oryzae]
MRQRILLAVAVLVLLAPGAFVCYLVLRPAPPLPLTVPTIPEPPAPVPDYEPWARQVASLTGIPPRALLAYARTQLRLSSELPSCGIDWATLAGVGSVESDHGRYGDRELTANGRPSRPIVGVPLDGSPAVASIPDTDDGALDGDPAWDRAVGPMQFIPGTWREWAADGDADGVTDPQDIDDATLAAGRYLCASGPLRTAEGWRAAVLSYNSSDSYLRAVLDATNGYAERSRHS